MQNGHDAWVHTLNPTDNGIRQAKLTGVHPSNISLHPLLAEMCNSPISAGTYHDQRVAISMLCGANQFEPQIGPWGRYVTLCKTVYHNIFYLSHFFAIRFCTVQSKYLKSAVGQCRLLCCQNTQMRSCQNTQMRSWARPDVSPLLNAQFTVPVGCHCIVGCHTHSRM